MKIKSMLLAVLAVSMAGVSAAALSQGFPERALRVVVPYPPGGTTDVLVRLLQKPVADAAGQSVVVDNRPGGASVIGTSHVAQAAPDGYTVLGGDLSMLVNPSLMKDLPYDTLRDFRGVTMLARAPLVLLVHPSVPANTLDELIALAKAKPGTLNFASGGYGTSTHMAGEMFRRAAASMSCMCRTRAWRRPCRRCWAGRCRCISAAPRRACRISSRASCARWR